MISDVAMGTRTLVVWCPDWPIVAAGIDGEVTPTVVVHANRVVACSAMARSEGVRRGLRRREAQSRCPELVVLQIDPAGEARAFEPVVAAVESLTPGIEITRPGVSVFATRGPSRYFGGDDALAERVAAVVPVTCRVGVADSVFAAWLAARSGTGVVAVGTTPAFLAPFPTSVLDAHGSTSSVALVDLLGRLGIRTLGEFAALPITDVVARFGPEGGIAHRLASGVDERPLAGRVPPPDLAVVIELDPPAERADVVTFAVRGLAADLHERLARRGLACTRVAIEAETEHGERLVRVWRSDGPLTPSAMADRVRWQIDGWLNTSWADRPSGGISVVQLLPEEVVADDGRQLGFWGGSSAADDRAARAFARLQGLFGPDAVHVATIVGGRGRASRSPRCGGVTSDPNRSTAFRGPATFRHRHRRRCGRHQLQQRSSTTLVVPSSLVAGWDCRHRRPASMEWPSRDGPGRGRWMNDGGTRRPAVAAFAFRSPWPTVPPPSHVGVRSVVDRSLVRLTR